MSGKFDFVACKRHHKGVDRVTTGKTKQKGKKVLLRKRAAVPYFTKPKGRHKPVFQSELNGFKRYKSRIQQNIENVEHGKYGKVEKYGDISEIRIKEDCGFRVYFAEIKKLVIVLLRVNKKKPPKIQNADFETARDRLQDVKDNWDLDALEELAREKLEQEERDLKDDKSK